MKSRPLVGIVCCNRLVGGQHSQAVINRYLEATVRYAGCAAVLIPARVDLIDAREIAERIDGLMLTGSPSNVDPSRYGVKAGADEGPFDQQRDSMSLTLIDAMLERDRPIFGICRGFQEINVAFGGTLVRDLGMPGREMSHHSEELVELVGMFAHRHDVTLSQGGILANAYDCDHLTVNSVHFQGVGKLGTGLAVEAVAADGVVEAFSAQNSGSPVVGVQWHPEWQTDNDPVSAGFFELFGRALRGEDISGRDPNTQPQLRQR